MTARTTGARHRAACRPSTPLSAFGQTVGGTAGRAAAVAASGMVLALGASSAVAAPVTAGPQAPMANLVAGFDNGDDSDTVSTSPTVSVDEDVDWSFTAATVSSEAPPPPPPPPPPPVAAPEQTEQRSAGTTASRSGERTAPAETTDDSAESGDSGESGESGESSEASTQAAPASGSGAAAVDIGRRYIGTPYVWGGGTPAGFDCSGFTAYVYAQLGVSLPRSSAAQRHAGRVVSASEARPGDMVWWSGHIGIYTGNGNHIAARNPSKPLTEGPISHVGRGTPVFIRVVE